MLNHIKVASKVYTGTTVMRFSNIDCLIVYSVQGE